MNSWRNLQWDDKFKKKLIFMSHMIGQKPWNCFRQNLSGLEGLGVITQIKSICDWGESNPRPQFKINK